MILPHSQVNPSPTQPSKHSHDPTASDSLLSSPSFFQLLGSNDTSSLSSSNSSTLSWLSSPLLDPHLSSTHGIELHFDTFNPFKPHYSHENQVSTRLLDDLLTTCSNRDFEKLWVIRCSRHGTWSRQSPAEHEMQFMIYDHGCSEGAWPPEYSPRPSPKPDAALIETCTPLPTPSKPWYGDFIAGCNTTNKRALVDHAFSIVIKGYWGSKPAIQLLAQEFKNQYCEQYSEPWLSDRAKAVVPFLATVHSCFQKKLGPYVAHCFQSCVIESTMNLFKLMWNSDQPCCVTYISTTSSDIKDALLLTRYLGALFQSSILTYHSIQVAIATLLDNLQVIEQIQALYYLIVEAGHQLWETPDSRAAMERWTEILEKNVAATIITSSASGNTRVVDFELNRWVKHVIDKVQHNTRKHHHREILESVRK